MKKCRMMVLAAVMLVLAAFCLSALADSRILMAGDSGEEVTRVQERLAELKYLMEAPTGVFDAATEEAVTLFQKQNRLLVSGMVDAKTMEVLFSKEAKVNRNVAVTPSPTAPGKLSGARTQSASESVVYDSAMADTEEAFEFEALSLVSRAAMPGSGQELTGLYWSDVPFDTTEYALFAENGFASTVTSPLSAFAADVDTASYAQIRAKILAGMEVPEDAVRIEEMLNYFSYDYPAPDEGMPFGVFMEMAECPWNRDTLLLQIGLQGKTIMPEERPRHNLVFLIDVSGSMFGDNKLGLVKQAFALLVEELEPTDTISIVTYASRDETLLSGVPAADKVRIMEVISNLEASGSTNSESGIQTAYKLAEEYGGEDCISRVIMATDGDFNVGMTSEGELARLVMEKKKNGVTLTMLGVGNGNYKDNKMEALADYGDGNYYYLDSVFEARRALVTEAGGTFVEIARDVKLNLDFNPAKIKAYRLIGYEDRVMAPEDFADDTKDGGEIGSGHRVTALYEIVPTGSAFEVNTPQSRYAVSTENGSDEWLTLNIRYKKPGENESTLEVFPFSEDIRTELSDNMKFAAAVAECGMLLRHSEYSGSASYSTALELVRDCNLVNGDAYKEEFLYLLTLLERSH